MLATASAGDAKASSATVWSVGAGTSRNRARVTMPSVPSLPARSDGKW